MRAHAVSSWPDSAVSLNDGRVTFEIPRYVKSDASVPSAFRRCERDLPGEVSAPTKKHTSIQAELNFANCMRAHGITNFPDPMPGGGFNIRGNTSSPQFQSANRTCEAKLSPGGARSTGS